MTLFDVCQCECGAILRVQYRGPSVGGDSVAAPSFVLCPFCPRTHEFVSEIVVLEYLSDEVLWVQVPVNLLPATRRSSQKKIPGLR
ncbi:MAG: hypothetical protein AB1898_00515 [Acidobacteriota bacterium]